MIVSPAFADAPWCDGPNNAVLYQGRRLDYRTLKARVQDRVFVLGALGLLPGQVVMVPDAPALELLLMQHSLARFGAILFPFRADLARMEVEELARLTGAEWRWLPESGHLRGISDVPQSAARCGDARISLLIKTSGSTGTPKVVMLTADNLLASAQATNARLGLGAGDLWLACLRQSHIGGVSIGYRCALAGAAVRLYDGFDAQAVGRGLCDSPVTHVSLVPPMLARLLELGVSPPPRLRVLLVGGQALSETLARRAVERGWPLHLTYGMTETASQIATTTTLTGQGMDTALAGRLLEGVEVDARPCETGASMRLKVKGRTLMAGYANPARRPGLGLQRGCFETPDIACVSADGQLRILGRADDVLVVGGINVSLRRVEQLLTGVPGVRDCVVLGLDDDVWGHRLAAVFSGEIDASGLEQWCRRHLQSAERPRVFRRLRELPLLDSGKHDRQRIRAELVLSGP
ncbi:AMP-binding protein [Thiocystis violacea]|uniref:AMP-binding protein n=1 Tax=Thiocystis violacea TaxID=13725 RepID=UPI0019031E37|nr:AMP-binding protein [Thiocystis violacea]MBK1721668.1 AMP-dependent synthetase [Thiocystis violacea]